MRSPRFLHEVFAGVIESWGHVDFNLRVHGLDAADEGEGHNIVNNDTYFDLTIAATDKFIVGISWLERETVAL